MAPMGMSSFVPSFLKSNKIRERSPPTGRIVDAFKEYINNEIPTWFIDTSTLRLVPRSDVFRVFQDDIANVTDERIRERMQEFRTDPLESYQPLRESALRRIIQEIVKYDILSHGRATAGEPTFQDIRAGKQHASGKLARFCETSSRLGRKLAWMDTCCIDKDNAAEISEAIHARYKWYANSYLCIVHLAESTSYADWPHESWFTRDWTLQELLAPSRLKFYDRNWRPFNPSDIDDDRQCLDIIHPLEDITGISRTVLTANDSHGVQGHMFWEIMSWASRRQTTRIEDRAYSLVGLLRANVTVSYGEGCSAFPRLIEAVANTRWDVFAWFGQPSAYHFALPPSPASYPRFEPYMAEGRVGVREFTIAPCELSLKSLPPVPMKLCSVTGPKGPRMTFFVSLKPLVDEENRLGMFEDLVVECGATRVRTIREARQLSACIINHHGASSRDKGKLMVGKDYICFLLYSKNEAKDRPTWMKLATDNLLQMTCVGPPETVVREQGMAESASFTLPLTTTFIRSCET